MRQVVARIDVDYRRPILFRPEPYAVETWVTRIGTSSYDLACRIVRRRTARCYSERRGACWSPSTAPPSAPGRSRDAERRRLEAVLEA